MNYITYDVELHEYNLNKYNFKFYHWKHPLYKIEHFKDEDFEKLEKIIKPGYNIVDIGAHIGDTTIPYAMVAGVKEGIGSVLAYEPNKNVFDILERNIEINNLNRVRIENIAIGSEDRKKLYYIDKGLCNGGPERICGPIEYECEFYNFQECMSIDHGLTYNDMQFLKIDTEGLEYEILSESTDFILANNPKMIVELYKFLDKKTRVNLFNLLKDLGYRTYNFTNAQMDLDLIDKELTEKDYVDLYDTHADLICLK